MKNTVIFFLMSFSLYSCVPSARITNLTPVYLYQEPTVTAYENPNSNMNWYRTFAVFPYSVLDTVTKRNPILDQQVLFYVRNLFELKGYKFIQLNEVPDFLITVDANSQYSENYVPPQQVTLPSWVPGKTVTVQGSSTANFNFNTFGDLNSYGWGSWTQNSTQTIEVPGYMTTQTYIGQVTLLAAIIQSLTLQHMMVNLFKQYGMQGALEHQIILMSDYRVKS